MSSNKSFSNEITERYAKAIFELARENKNLQEVENNVKDLLKVYDSNSNLENFIKNPTQSFQTQLEIINKISEVMNFSTIFKNFLSILVLKRRIFFFKKIMLNFLKLMATFKGELSAKLISSKSLSDSELKNISSELSKILGSELNFDYSVDKNLIGGFKMQIGSLMIDTSIKNKLKKYQKIMLEN